jgi:tetrahydromethanopterin S-methyltransferase subunit E
MALLAGSAMYVVTIYSLLTDLVTSQLPLIKIVLGIIIVLLLVYVLPNKKYENTFRLVEKIWGLLS